MAAAFVAGWAAGRLSAAGEGDWLPAPARRARRIVTAWWTLAVDEADVVRRLDGLLGTSLGGQAGAVGAASAAALAGMVGRWGGLPPWPAAGPGPMLGPG